MEATEDTKHKATPLITQLTITTPVFIFCVLFFCLLRNRWKEFYSPKTSWRGPQNPLPPLPRTIFSWIPALYRIKENDIMSSAGLDAVMCLRFWKMGLVLFSFLMFWAVFVLIPLDLVTPPDKREDSQSSDDSSDQSSVTRPYYITHMVFTWMFSFFAYYLLYRNYRKFIILRQQFLRDSAIDIRSRTVLVTGIPSRYRTEENLTAYFNGLSIGTIDQVVLNREVSELEAVLKKRFEYLDKLERTYMKLIRRSTQRSSSEIASEVDFTLEQPLLSQSNDAFDLDQVASRRPTTRTGFLGLFGNRVDALDYYYSKFQFYDQKVTEKRSQYYPPASSAFITFATQNAANIAAQTLNSHKPYEFVTRMAREPRDIYWPNATIHPMEKNFHTLFVHIAVTLIVLFWTIPSALISSLLSSNTLERLFPNINRILSPWTLGLIQGSLPTIAVAGFSSLVPHLMAGLSRFQGLRTYSSIQNAQMSKYFVFIFINILLVFMIAGTTFKALEGIKNPEDLLSWIGKLLNKLGEELPKVSSFFINYVILHSFVVLPFVELTRIDCLIFGWINKLTWQTPRDRSEYFSPVFVNYGSLYSMPMLLFIVILTYSIIAPLITVFGTLYFLIGFTIYRHHLVYIYRTRYDSGGSIWPCVFQRLLWGLILFQLTMTAIFSLLKGVRWLSGFTFPLVFISVIFGYFCEQNFGEYANVLSLDVASDLDATAVAESEDLSDPYYPRESTPVSPATFDPSVRAEAWQSITRVPGVLDMEDTTYHHPALVGELPYLWLPKGYVSRATGYFTDPLAY
ncbi:DUF221-domain-containing protein [Basidiobolus meristosporus CBS 931.73]|uniref:DUF221-domain-containing protein n=1 Tax=Basidiobolus meristosporus CBS 931.73 TaxID=1314790 RepID=A0A1Y1ZBT4_9FUNG|nr:DUF221-domain-containing protein [Basidiobolus meristosporus CBS 931.73]|eukprot:ORY07751.1 DUF221-domain-containing protein [Basidiobolus meristosporus CBS 931.73]